MFDVCQLLVARFQEAWYYQLESKKISQQVICLITNLYDIGEMQSMKLTCWCADIK